jgi:hypothetical protein
MGDEETSYKLVIKKQTNQKPVCEKEEVRIKKTNHSTKQ